MSAPGGYAPRLAKAGYAAPPLNDIVRIGSDSICASLAGGRGDCDEDLRDDVTVSGVDLTTFFLAGYEVELDDRTVAGCSLSDRLVHQSDMTGAAKMVTKRSS